MVLCKQPLSKTKTCKTLKKALKKIRMRWFSIDFKFNSLFNGLLGLIFCYKNRCTKNVQKLFCLKNFVRFCNGENGKRKTSHVTLVFIFFYLFDNDNRIHIQYLFLGDNCLTDTVNTISINHFQPQLISETLAKQLLSVAGVFVFPDPRSWPWCMVLALTPSLNFYLTLPASKFIFHDASLQFVFTCSDPQVVFACFLFYS